MGCTIETWRATASSDYGDRTLKVVGDGECTMGGYKLSLEPTNEGIVDDPTLVAIRLVIEEPEAGPDVITAAHVEYEAPVEETVTRVRIDTPDGSQFVDVKGEGRYE